MQQIQNAPRLGRNRATHRQWRGLLGPALVVVVIWLAVTAQPAWAEPILVVANSGIAVDSISREELKQAYLGESEFIGGQKVELFQYPENSDLTAAFLKSLSLKPNKYKSHWIKMVFRTGGVPPQRVHDAAEMIAKVGATPGGIGFLEESALGTGTDIKVLLKIGE